AHLALRTRVDHAEQVHEPLLLLDGAAEVPGAHGVVEAYVSGRVHVAEAGDDAVGAGQQGGVDGELGTGEDAEAGGGTGGAAVTPAEGDDQPAQSAFVAAAVLQTGQGAVLGEFADQGHGELAVHRDGQVVRVQGQVDAGAQGAEVAGDLDGVGAGVEGCGRDERVGPGGTGGLRVGQHAGCGHVDD